MRNIDKIYIDGAFVTPHGTERFDLFNPATEEVIGQVTLGDREDAQRAIAAAKRAFPAFSRTGKAERVDMLRRLHAAVSKRLPELTEASILEFGAPVSHAEWRGAMSAHTFLDAADVLESYDFTRWIRDAEVVMQP